MVALRALWGEDCASHDEWRLPVENPADWLTLQQAACELDVSASTLRRMMKDGRLRHRPSVRAGRRICLVYVRDSLHGARSRPSNVIDLSERRLVRDANPPPLAATAQRSAIQPPVHGVEHLLKALSRPAVRRSRALPLDTGGPQSNPADPYGRYRWLARRRRWWPFS